MRLPKLLVSLLFVVCAIPSLAQSLAPTVDKGDSVWMIVATALVLLMTPALALFYAGMVQRKNVLNTMMLSFVMMGVVSLSWVLIGYTLSFGKSNGFIGGLEYAFANGVSLRIPYGSQTIPAALFLLFQMKFAIITPALMSGAVAERIKFGGYLVFTLLWSILIYAPIACWVWNPDGWLCKMGALDFAGGTVVHLASGVSALALCLVLGRRKTTEIAPNNLTITLLGAGLLWFGWFGFNAGSSLAMNDVAINAFLTTHLAAAAGMLAWMLVEYVRHQKATTLGGASGLVAGLVVITPAAGFVSVGSAILIGLSAGVLCCLAIELKHKFGYDDALDVVAVHGIGGLVGSILTGVLASSAINPVVEASLSGGRTHLIFVQLLTAGVVIVVAGSGSWLLARGVNATVGLRADVEHEEVGLDRAYHGEGGYELGESLLPQERELVGA